MTFSSEQYKADIAIQGSVDVRVCPAPKGYDAYLTGLYGDYMRLPPEDKRRSEHEICAYLKEEV